MKTVVCSLAALLCTSACSFLDELDRSVENKMIELKTGNAPEAPPSATAVVAPPPPAPKAPAAPPPPSPPPVPLVKPSGTPRVAIQPVTVHGALTAKQAHRIVERHVNELRFCFEQSAVAAAKVTLKAVISPTGAVQVASIESSDSGDHKLDMCFVQAVRRWAFPSPTGGGIAVLEVPIVLSRTVAKRDF